MILLSVYCTKIDIDIFTFYRFIFFTLFKLHMSTFLLKIMMMMNASWACLAGLNSLCSCFTWSLKYTRAVMKVILIAIVQDCQSVREKWRRRQGLWRHYRLPLKSRFAAGRVFPCEPCYFSVCYRSWKLKSVIDLVIRWTSGEAPPPSSIWQYFPGRPGLAGTRMSPFWILLELRMTEVVVTTGAIRHATLQS